MKFPEFFTDYETIIDRIHQLDPVKYAKSRNFLDGHISYLSPFITHGIISTKTVADIVLKKHSVKSSEKLLAELGWREFFHRVWQDLGEDIFNDVRYDQTKVISEDAPSAILNGQSDIEGLDQAIEALTQQGYMHNHARMWLASVVCNVAQTHWYEPSRWLYYHLLDGDLASNTLSWQWICGTFSHKKYYANQENLNKYSGTQSRNTYLDIDYESFDTMDTPEVLTDRTKLELTNDFPQSTQAPITACDQTVFLYSIWNLDPLWQQDQDGLRVLWIDPGMHKEFALSPLRWKFITHWAQHIPRLKIFVGSQDELFPDGIASMQILTREYPETKNWPGTRDDRAWLYPEVSGYFKNFFSFWKKAQKTLPGLGKLHQPHKN